MPARSLVAALAAAVTIGVAAPAGAAHAAVTGGVAGAAHAAVRPHPGVSPAALALARQALPVNDGWASTGPGTTGGSAADDAHVTVTHDRAELVAAVAGDTPKIVLVSGDIDLSVDAANQHRDCASYADPDYSLDAFLAAYDPAVWGRTTKPSGPLEDARTR